jgi:carboxylate-amine ligase
MVGTGFIETIRELWWDVRPHNNFGTVEVRMCDMPGSLTDTLALAALIHCLVKSLSDEIDEGAYQHDSHPLMVRQNKWRASRFGIRAELVDSPSYTVRTVEQIVNELVTHLTPAAEELGCIEHLEQCRAMAVGPSWAERQIKLAEETDSFESVVRQLTQQSRISPAAAKQVDANTPALGPPHFVQEVRSEPTQPL